MRQNTLECKWQQKDVRKQDGWAFVFHHSNDPTLRKQNDSSMSLYQNERTTKQFFVFVCVFPIEFVFVFVFVFVFAIEFVFVLKGKRICQVGVILDKVGTFPWLKRMNGLHGGPYSQHDRNHDDDDDGPKRDTKAKISHGSTGVALVVEQHELKRPF